MSDKNFNPKSVAIAATTSYPEWYRGKLRSIRHTDKIRGDLALESIRQACRIGYQIIIADWISPQTFLDQLNSISGVILIRRRSPKRSPAKRQALQKASKLPMVRVIVLTELEKVSFIKGCIPLIVQPILDGEVDIVIPKRNEELFKKTYPVYQYESEIEGNNLYNEKLRSHNIIDNDESFDMFFGPRAFSSAKSITSLFMKRYYFHISNELFSKWHFDAEELSNANYFPIVAALKKGLKVKSIEVPFEYPITQKQNEDRGLREIFLEKRHVQRVGLIEELLHFVAYLERYGGTELKLS